MSKITIKPITDKQPPLGKLFRDTVLKDLPLMRFEQEQKRKRKKMKF